jgi:flagellar hook assembly protein FlgD
VYCRTITVPTLAGNREVLLPFPDANFRQTTPGEYKVCGKIFFPGNDLDTLDDSTFTMFRILFGPAFAYEENPLQPVNDVPNQAFSGVSGKGLNHRAGNSGSGPGSLYSYPFGGGPAGQYSTTFYGYGPTAVNDSYGADAGNASGSTATRFTLYTQDTVTGYQAYWAELNQDILNISFELYRDQGGIPGGQRLNGSSIIRQRGRDETDEEEEPVFGKYATYLLDEPVVLAPGEYWVSVSQMGTEGFELGASSTRMGMVTTLYSDIPAFGTGNRTLMIDKNFRSRARSGALLNDNRFAFELTRGAGDWVPFMPTIGNPAYPHLNATGTSLGYNTHTRGTWIPLLRPYFGDRSFAQTPVYVNCIQPVELTYFEGKSRTAGIDLFWETASEENNLGFRVDRRAVVENTNLTTGATEFSCVDQSGSEGWTEIGFVAGALNTTETMNYKHFDANVQSGFTYQYRLRQIDVDGREYFSNVINVVVSDGNLALDNNVPNPASDKTTFTFYVAQRSNVKFEVFDMMGNLVKTLYNDEVAGQSAPYTLEWNGRDEAGYEVASGSYMYKLTAGENTLSKTMTIVR